MKTLTFAELIEPFHLSVRNRIIDLAEDHRTAGLALYQNQMLDSSYMGDVASHVFGPGWTYQTAQQLPPRIGAVPSQFQELVGVWEKALVDLSAYRVTPAQLIAEIESSSITIERIHMNDKLLRADGTGYAVIVNYCGKGVPFTVCPLEHFEPDLRTTEGTRVDAMHWQKRYSSSLVDEGAIYIERQGSLIARLSISANVRRNDSRHKETAPEWERGR